MPHLVWLAVGCFVVSHVLWLLPWPQWPLWFVYTGAVGTLVGIDALTTYLPKRLHYLCLAELTLATIGVGLLAGWHVAGRTICGGLVAGALFYIVWRFSSGFGFGDVRLAMLVGGVAAASGWGMLAQALVLGTIFGALWGIITALLTRRRGEPSGPFPYGPALWLGPFAAVALNTLIG